MVSRVIPVDPFDLVIFGGTGDLACRKILPGLFRRYCTGQMTAQARVIGSARSEMDQANYQSFVARAIRQFDSCKPCEDGKLDDFLACVDYVRIDVRGIDGWAALAEKLRDDVIRAFYFSVAPALFGDLAERIRSNGMRTDATRIVVEKPFGKDLTTARALNASLAMYFNENQIYRIDHYLGKETVQNLMAVRFGNVLFEPLWNSHFVDHIQITVAETVGVGGRGEYYDKAGAMRDMVQNHLMQLLCLIAMEPPSQFEPDAVRDEKLKVIRALDPVESHHIVRGQYDARGDELGYREAAGDPQSRTESYIALKTHVRNWRWADTPFYLRTGKRLSARSSEIIVMFKPTPHFIFGTGTGASQNILLIRLQPNEGITLQVTIKEPGPGGMRLVDVPLDMTFAEALEDGGDNQVEAYERLIMDVIRGNQTLFMRGDEVEAAWAWTDPIIQGWESRNDVPKPYDAGSSGPGDADFLLHREGRKWHRIKA